MRKTHFLLLALFLWSAFLGTCHAQKKLNIFSNSTKNAYSFENIRALTFENKQLNVHFKDGNLQTLPLVDLQKLTFDLSNNISLPKLPSEEIKLYPNPVSDFLFIDASNAGIETKNISIFDLNGKSIYKKRTKKIPTSIDVRNFRNGVYILEIETGKEKTTKKIIIKH